MKGIYSPIIKHESLDLLGSFICHRYYFITGLPCPALEDGKSQAGRPSRSPISNTCMVEKTIQKPKPDAKVFSFFIFFCGKNFISDDSLQVSGHACLRRQSGQGRTEEIRIFSINRSPQINFNFIFVTI